jgi:DNA-binding HxlR family transcriptional regulator
MRSGSEALCLLAVPLNVQVLQALDEEPLSLADLRRAAGHPPVTTMRSYLRKLTGLGILKRHREDDFPGSVSYTLTRQGNKLMIVAGALRDWLRHAPEGAVDLEGLAAKGPIKALVDGWDVGIIRALAARPLALTELDRLIPSVTYPALERRLTAMRQVGLVEPDPHRTGRVARCRVTSWLRHAVVPLSAAIGWERQCIPDQAPALRRTDAEAAFLLTVPLLTLPPELDGTCRLAVESRRGSELDFAGVTATVREGGSCTCVSRLEGEPDAWATGSVLSWTRWLSDGDTEGMEIGGDLELVRAFERGFRTALLSAAGR